MKTKYTFIFLALILGLAAALLWLLGGQSALAVAMPNGSEPSTANVGYTGTNPVILFVVPDEVAVSFGSQYDEVMDLGTDFQIGESVMLVLSGERLRGGDFPHIASDVTFVVSNEAGQVIWSHSIGPVGAGWTSGPGGGWGVGEWWRQVDNSGLAVPAGIYTAGIILTDPTYPVSSDYSDALPISIVDGTYVFYHSTIDLGANATALAAGDINGDSHIDLVFGNGDNKVYLNNGDGSFSYAYSFGETRDWSDKCLRLADLNGDGYLDLVEGILGDPQTVVRIYENDGTGVFSQSTLLVSLYPPWYYNTNQFLTLGDLDNDGDLDVVVALYSLVEIYWNDGDGTFTKSSQVIPSTQVYAVALGDVDGDGDLDMVLANSDNLPNKVFLNDGSGYFIDTGQSLGSEFTYHVALADIDNDNDLDLIAGNIGGKKIYRNDGKGNFSFWYDLAEPNDYSYVVSLGDVDSDGDLDMIAVGGNRTYVYVNDGQGVFSNSGHSLQRALDASLVDVTSRGNLDLVTAGIENKLYYNNLGMLVTKQVQPQVVRSGAQLTYTIYITNTGNVDLHATVTDTLPTHVTQGETSGGTVILPGGMITWTPIITAPGGVWQETVVVTVEMDYIGPLTNVVQVTTQEGAAGSYVHTLAPAVDVFKKVSPNQVQGGERIVYTIYVTNTGNFDLHTVITDTLPAHITGAETSSGRALLPGEPMTWTAFITAPRGVWADTLVVTVEKGYSGTLVNMVQVTSAEGASRSYIATSSAHHPRIYLPLILRGWPPIPGTPVLNPIVPESYGCYFISWNSTERAQSYTLEEATIADFSDAKVIYQDAGTAHTITDQSPNLYFYRVKAVNEGWFSRWSNVQVIFYDDFSDPGSGWYVGEDNIDRWRYMAGGRYEGTIKQPGWLTFARAPIEADNYTFQVEAYPVSQPYESIYGLIFGLSDDWTQYYLFSVTPADSGYYRIDKHTSAGWTELRGWTPRSISSSYSTLKVVRQGVKIEVYIDGSYVDTVYDGELTGKRHVGVMVGSFDDASGWATIQFDNFMLTTTADGIRRNAIVQFDPVDNRSIADSMIALPDTR